MNLLGAHLRSGKGKHRTISPWKGAKCHFFVISFFHGLFECFLMDTVEKGFLPEERPGSRPELVSDYEFDPGY